MWRAAYANGQSSQRTRVFHRAQNIGSAAARRDANGDIARLYGAASGTLYLLRPDLHIAGRWKTIASDEVLHTARLCLGIPT